VVLVAVTIKHARALKVQEDNDIMDRAFDVDYLLQYFVRLVWSGRLEQLQ
jgi:hypothetical protein